MLKQHIPVVKYLDISVLEGVVVYVYMKTAKTLFFYKTQMWLNCQIFVQNAKAAIILCRKVVFLK